MRSIVIIIVLLQLNDCVRTSNRRICPSGSVFVDTFAKCYTFLKAPTAWANAEQQCRNLFPPDGHLVSIASGFENSFINALKQLCTDVDAWIGGNNLNNPNNQSSFSWSDNTNFNYNRWAPSFPIANRSLNCIASNIHSTADSSYWTNANCLASKPAICQSSPIDLDANITSVTCGSPIVRPACPSEWTYYEKTQSCYTVQYFTSSFDDAETRCQTLGGHLVSIHSLDENNFVADLASIHARSLGGRVPDNWQTLIGLHNPTHSRWIWSDGSSATDYINWAQGEPNDENNNEWCVYLYTDPRSSSNNPLERYLNKWNDFPCVSTQRAFVCKRNISTF